MELDDVGVFEILYNIHEWYKLACCVYSLYLQR